MKHLRLSELNQLIKETLDANLQATYWLIAEIGEMRVAGKGHCYLELIEKVEDEVVSRMRGNIWAYNYRAISGWFESITGQSLKSGMEILCHAAVTYHPVFGMSLTIKDVDPNYTLGERARRKQQIIQQLKEDGIFDMNRELDLPLVAQKIAVISSSTAAGFGDFMDQITANLYGYKFDITLFQAAMQGEQAPAQIIEALHQIADNLEDFDLVAIIRGGGSQLDLDCFDNYDLVSHIAQFPLPIITGIGHERDETIADMVAHTKVKTPTALAEFLISGLVGFEENLLSQAKIMADRVNNILKDENFIVMQKANMLERIVVYRLQSDGQTIAILGEKLKSQAKNTLREQDRLQTDLEKLLNKYSFASLKNQSQQLEFLEQKIKGLDPQQLLDRGYSITLVDGKNINKVKRIKIGSKLTTITKNRTFESTLDLEMKREEEDK
ncbi:exodeoxyribonuclease VII large subunit [Peijinzhouia sedimentorum]